MDGEAARRPERAPTPGRQVRTSDAIWPGTDAFTLAARPGAPKDVQASFLRRPISSPSPLAGPRGRGLTGRPIHRLQRRATLSVAGYEVDGHGAGASAARGRATAPGGGRYRILPVWGSP
jgi:hypothetical protein